MTKLSNVRGRITYISSHAKQEHLYAVYETTDRNYWTELARCSQQEFNKSGVEALHHNKRMTNFHIHLIFSERQLLEEPVIKTATRNMFYDERGNHVRTKKEILDEAGNIRKRCKVIGKGEVYEKKLFTSKNMKFKQEEFLDEAETMSEKLARLQKEADSYRQYNRRMSNKLR